jgi:hypothetical protein
VVNTIPSITPASGAQDKNPIETLPIVSEEKPDIRTITEKGIDSTSNKTPMIRIGIPSFTACLLFIRVYAINMKAENTGFPLACYKSSLLFVPKLPGSLEASAL